METRRPKYKTLTEWHKAEPNAYAAAYKLGLLDSICTKLGWKKYKRPSKWTYDICKEEALKYNIKEHWKKKSGNSYAAAIRNGWYNELTTHMVDGCTPKNYWTKERCIEEAKKYDMKEKWKKSHPPSYQASQRNGWVEELSTHMPNKFKNKGFWTKENCIKEALKYKSINEWVKCKNASIQVARVKNWMDECTKHMRVKAARNYWTKERCIEEALKYSSRNKWKKNSSSYSIASSKGWLEECTKHMPKLTGKKVDYETNQI